MCAATVRTKPVGGIRAVAVIPSLGAAATGSPAEVAAAAVGVPLAEGRSQYEERVEADAGAVRVEHRLTIAMPADYARQLLTEELCRRWTEQGTAAVVETESGERLVVGWSERMGAEQPLRLVSAEFGSGLTPQSVPVAILTLRSADTAPAVRIQNP